MVSLGAPLTATGALIRGLDSGTAGIIRQLFGPVGTGFEAAVPAAAAVVAGGARGAEASGFVSVGSGGAL